MEDAEEVLANRLLNNGQGRLLTEVICDLASCRAGFRKPLPRTVRPGLHIR